MLNAPDVVDTWARQGRLTVQTSHNLIRKGRWTLAAKATLEIKDYAEAPEKGGNGSPAPSTRWPNVAKSK